MTEPTKFEFWCNIEGEPYVFLVPISLDKKIDNLKSEIYNKALSSFIGFSSPNLTLTKVCYIMISM